MFTFFSLFRGKKITLKTAKVVLSPRKVGKAIIKKATFKPKGIKPLQVKRPLRPLVKAVAKPAVIGFKRVLCKPLAHKQPAPLIVKPAAIVKKPIVPVVKSNVVAKGILPIIYPYKFGSEAAQLLATELKTKRVSENGNYVYRPNHLIINYGNKRMPIWANGVKVNVLNNWDAIRISSNKLTALQCFRDNSVQTVEFTTDKAQAIAWIKKEKVVMCRTILNGYGGHGIVIAKNEKELVDSPLYCVYKKSIAEYRVVIVNGIVVDFMQKKRKLDFEEQTGKEINGMVRNHENGFIYARNEVSPPKQVLDEAVKAVTALKLNFAGVDIIYNQKENKAYVLEANSSIGMEEGGTTLKRLSVAFKAICNNQPPVSII
jgi:hypothetical protein